MIHAYNELYLPMVMKNLAAMTELAICAEGLEPDAFGTLFARSSVAGAIENAVPDLLAGKSATEMLSLVLGREVPHTTVSADRTSEYWAGWVLARAQWELRKPFAAILSVMPLSALLALYYPYHEADESKTVAVIRARLSGEETTLRTLRRRRKLTQEQLSALSGVSLRSIRSYEQRENEIAKANGEILQALAQTLDCRIEDLLTP